MLLPALPTIEAVTFASKPKAVFIPVREAGKALGWPIEYDAVLDFVKLKGKILDPFAPQLSDGTWLISAADLAAMGGRFDGRSVKDQGKGFLIKVGQKRVAIDLSGQTLRAWQGQRLVYLWPISSGREGKETPNGDFKAGGKEPMHISTLYGSPMPFSVHVVGNIFIHGSDRFSSSPGSHGCIRLPLMERRNVAEEFYNWVEAGIPIRIRGAFKFQERGKD